MFPHAQLGLVQEIAQARGLDTVILRSPAALSWMTGARWHLQHDLHATTFDLVITGLDGGEHGVQVVTNVIEGPRLRAEELSGLIGHWDVRELPWTTPRPQALPTGPRVGADLPLAGMVDLGPDLARVRRVLTPGQVARLTALVHDAAAIVGLEASRSHPGEREWDVAARVRAALVAAGMEPVVCLVGSGERLDTVRHPLPTERRVTARLMISISARRHGLLAAITRCVRWADGVGERRYLDLLKVESGFLAASRPGRTLAAAFADGIAGYAAHGFAADEWTRHHQGGFTGFAPRELLATPDTDEPIELGAAVAWNPSAWGWKVEATSLVTAAGARPLDLCPGWPVVEVDGRTRPAILHL